MYRSIVIIHVTNGFGDDCGNDDDDDYDYDGGRLTPPNFRHIERKNRFTKLNGMWLGELSSNVYLLLFYYIGNFKETRENKVNKVNDEDVRINLL